MAYFSWNHGEMTLSEERLSKSSQNTSIHMHRYYSAHNHCPAVFTVRCTVLTVRFTDTEFLTTISHAHTA